MFLFFSPTFVSNSPGVETSCDGRQNGTQCFGALGGSLVLRLMDSFSEIYRYMWFSKASMILHGRKNQIVTNEIPDRSFFNPTDGTFRINNLNWTDGGEYRLHTYDSRGRKSELRTQQLTIEGK